MHFQVERGLASLLANMEPDDAKEFFDLHVLYAREGEELGRLMYNDLIQNTKEKKKLTLFYQENKDAFTSVLKKYKILIQ